MLQDCLTLQFNTENLTDNVYLLSKEHVRAGSVLDPASILGLIEG